MTVATPDTIEREITVHLSVGEVFQAFSDSAQLSKWFCETIEGDLAEGSEVVLAWKEDKCRAYIEAIEDGHRFAYRWISGFSDAVTPVLSKPNTLVEFFIESTEEGTRIRLVESGFSALPDEWRERGYQENSGGWDWEMNDLKQYFDG